MPRKLPWQHGAVIAGKATTSRTAKQRSALDSEQNESKANRRTGTPKTPSRTSKIGTQEPPSSPLAEAPVSPPTPRCMREGLNGDDVWIMVEDEFMSTARDFTRHLHQAEYDRLQAMAKARNATATHEITQHQDHWTLSDEARSRKQPVAVANKQKALLASPESDEDSSDDPWSQNPQLANLMSQPRQSSYSQLSGITAIKPNTRASLGYPQSESQVMNLHGRNTASFRLDRVEGSSDVDDSLNNVRPPRKRTTASLGRSRDPSSMFQEDGSPRDDSEVVAKRSFNPSYRRGSSISRIRDEIKPEPKSTVLQALLTEASTAASTNVVTDLTGSTGLEQRMAKRTTERLRRKRKKESISMDQVPTFLI